MSADATPVDEERAQRNAFDEACARAAIAPDDGDALWRLFTRWRWTSRTTHERLGELFAEYRHWRTFASSRSGAERSAERFELEWRSRIRSSLSRRFRVDDIDEIAATFFERVYRLVGTRYAWRCPFSVYLKTILVNVVRNYCRSQARRANRELSLGEPERALAREPRANELDAEQQLIRAEQAARVRRALVKLAPIDRQLIRGALVEGRSGRELAEQLGLSREAVYKRLQRSRAKLRVTLAPERSRRSRDAKAS